jgi:hypothetical protein
MLTDVSEQLAASIPKDSHLQIRIRENLKSVIALMMETAGANVRCTRDPSSYFASAVKNCFTVPQGSSPPTALASSLSLKIVTVCRLQP